MLESEALAVLNSLVKGVDPTTGEVLDTNHLIRDETVGAALAVALDVLGRFLTSVRQRDVRPSDPVVPKSGTGWTPNEDSLLSEAVSGMSVDEMTAALDDVAARHQRKPSAIASRLAHLRIIENRFEVLAGSAVA